MAERQASLEPPVEVLRWAGGPPMYCAMVGRQPWIDRISDVSAATKPPGFQLEVGVKAQGISASMSEAGWPAAMASSVVFR